MATIVQRDRFTWAVIAGLALGLALTASPLTCLLLASAPWLLRAAARGLPESERRILIGILLAALAARVAVLGALLVAGLPLHNSLSIGALSGDEAYNLARALRTRDAWLGVATSRYDYFVVFDDYGRSSYLTFLTWLQVLFGPTPFAARVLNSALFVAGGAILFRLTRPGLGAVPAFGGLIVLLFLPSLFHTSITLLKESAYLVATAALLSATAGMLRAGVSWRAAALLVVMGSSLWLLADLRRGGLGLALVGLGLGLVAYVASATFWRAAAAIALLVAATTAFVATPAARDRAVGALESAAKIHSGHIFTVGHSYQLLDPGYYMKPAPASASSLDLTPDHALRFAIRAVGSFILTPLPWEMRSVRELAFMPELLVWYALIILLPAGLVAGWRRDRLVTCLLAGYAATIGVVIAITTGNVGTLLRLRGLVTPLICWLSVLGLCALAQAAVRRHPRLLADSPPSPGQPVAVEIV